MTIESCDLSDLLVEIDKLCKKAQCAGAGQPLLALKKAKEAVELLINQRINKQPRFWYL